MKQSPFKFHPEILSTTNYAIFKDIDGNRYVNPLHVRRIQQSMSENLLFSPILVNEKHEIIDGQHRFEALSSLGHPIYYIKVYGYGLEQVHILNTNHSNWQKKDYLDGYADKGKKDYVLFKKFQNDFPELNFLSCQKILVGNKTGDNHTNQLGVSKTFQKGLFKIRDLKNSYDVANKIMEFKQFFPRFNDSVFVTTLLNLFEHPNYIHKDMLGKLKLQPTALEVCRHQEQYLLLLEDIYNFKRRDKVSLRY